MIFGKRYGRYIRNIVLALVAPIAAVSAYVGILQLTGNFHEVITGELYRAAQISGNDISEYKMRYGIKTVINLRGENKGSDWYDEEIKASRDNGIEHIDFRMSAKRELTQEQISSLIDILRKAERPILIHCRQGADRTGLASALYLSKVKNQDEGIARNQLSLQFGHVGIPYLSSAYAMDRTYARVSDKPH